jgi:acylphosphatase
MKTRVRIPLLFVTVLALAIAVLGIDVKTDFDHHVNFSGYKTYSWSKVDTPDPLWNDRVKDAVDRELTAKGWTEVASDGDVSVMAMGTTREKPTLRTFYDGFDGWMWGGFGDATTYVENYTVGTLVIDIFDTRTKKLIWRGSASDVLSGKPEKDEKKVDKAVGKMFEHFPPREA